MRYLLIIVGTIFMTACTVTQPHVTEYILSPKINTTPYKAKSCQESSLKVGQIFSPKSLMTKKMKYIENEYEEASFSQSEWARTPNRAILDVLIKSIRISKIFSDVSSFHSRVSTDMLLETHIEKFIQYFEKNNQKSYVEIVVTYNLIDIISAKSIAHTTISVQVDSTDVNAKSGVVALNEALSQTLEKTNQWLAGICK